MPWVSAAVRFLLNWRVRVNRRYHAYLQDQGREIPDTAGELVTADGNVVGAHGGIHGFTVGQRKGGVDQARPGERTR